MTHTTLALNLDKYGQILWGRAIPRREGFQKLKTIGFRIDCNLNRETILWRGLEGILARVISTRREFETGGCLKLELLAVWGRKCVRERVER